MKYHYSDQYSHVLECLNQCWLVLLLLLLYSDFLEVCSWLDPWGVESQKPNSIIRRQTIIWTNVDRWKLSSRGTIFDAIFMEKLMFPFTIYPSNGGLYCQLCSNCEDRVCGIWQGSWGQHGAHLGPVGPRWAPYRPHEPCYQGYLM